MRRGDGAEAHGLIASVNLCLSVNAPTRRSTIQHSSKISVYVRVKVCRGWAGLLLSPLHWLLLRAGVFIQHKKSQYQLADNIKLSLL